MAVFTLDIVKKIDREADLSFKIISKDEFETAITKADTLGTNVYSNDKFLIESSYDENKHEQLVVYSYEKISLIDREERDQGVFSCSSFTSIDLHNVDTSEMTKFDEIFFGCKAKHIDVSTIDTSNVTDMTSAFGRITLEELDLSNLNTSKVEEMNSTFSESKIKHLKLGFDTSKVKNMEGMFSYAEFGDLDISMFDTSNVTDMTCMFMNMKAKSINLGEFNLSSLIYADYMFCRCDAYEEGRIKSNGSIKKLRNINNEVSYIESDEVLKDKILDVLGQNIASIVYGSPGNELTEDRKHMLIDIINDIVLDGKVLSEYEEFLKEYKIREALNEIIRDTEMDVFGKISCIQVQ